MGCRISAACVLVMGRRISAACVLSMGGRISAACDLAMGCRISAACVLSWATVFLQHMFLSDNFSGVEVISLHLP